jgi:hypothetical protein
MPPRRRPIATNAGEEQVRRIIGTIGATLAIVALVAGATAPANAQSAIEYALMSGFVASGDGGPGLEAVGLASRFGSEPGRESGRTAGDAGLSGAFVYRTGRYSPLGAIAGAAPLSDPPGFPGASTFSTHFAINDRGAVAGIYGDSVPGADGRLPAGSIHGFVKDRRGKVTSFDVPGARDVLVQGINNRGRVVGEYVDRAAVPGPNGLLPAGSVHGLVRRPNGRLTTFDVPFAYLHDIGDINDRGQIVGCYDDPDRPYNLAGGFLRQPDGKITKLDVPGALSTSPRCINNLGQVFGSYIDADAKPNPDGSIPQRVIHGFVWKRGEYRSFDPAGSVYTEPTGCNDRGQITGGYQDRRGNEHGFLLRGGRITKLDAPDRSDNIAWGINNRGEVVIPEPTVRLGYRVAAP